MDSSMLPPEPRVFLQTRPTTCGVACMMMILNAFFGQPLTTSTERHHLKHLRLKGWDLVPAANLAAQLAREGLGVAVHHENPERFWQMLRHAPETLYLQQIAAYDRARRAGVTIYHDPVTGEGIAEELATGRMIIYGINLWGGVKHAILAYGHGSGGFLIIDPLEGKKQVGVHDLLAAGTADVGRWYISVDRETTPQRDASATECLNGLRPH